MPRNLSCKYCLANVVMVDGILGSQTFCPDCRRFQPERESTIETALRWWIENRRVAQEPVTAAR
jgi:hypothetical protein